MVTHLPGHWAWGVEWIWVGGYSGAATTIILLNIILFISIIRQVLTPFLELIRFEVSLQLILFRNRYLHYSFNYVVFALSFRSQKMIDNE